MGKNSSAKKPKTSTGLVETRGRWADGPIALVGPIGRNDCQLIFTLWFNGDLMGFNQQNGGFNGIYPLVI